MLHGGGPQQWGRLLGLQDGEDRPQKRKRATLTASQGMGGGTGGGAPCRRAPAPKAPSRTAGEGGGALRNKLTLSLGCAQFAQEAATKVTGMAKNSQHSDQTRMGMVFAETNDDVACLVFVAPDYPERVAKQLVDKHARAVESMTKDGA